MTEFVVRLTDERGRVQEQTHAAATAEELRARFSQAGYHVYSVKARGALAGTGRKKVKLETFLIFNQQFLTLIRAGLPILGSLELLARRQKQASFRAQLEDIVGRVKTASPSPPPSRPRAASPSSTPPPSSPASDPATSKKCSSAFSTSNASASPFARSSRPASSTRPLLIVMVIGPSSSFSSPSSSPSSLSSTISSEPTLPALTHLSSRGRPRGPSTTASMPPSSSPPPSSFSPAGSRPTPAQSPSIDSASVFPSSATSGSNTRSASSPAPSPPFSPAVSPLVPSLETAARSIDSRQIGSAVFRSVETVREGKGLSASLQATNVFPELAIEMIEVGESTGALPGMLNSVAEFFEEDVPDQPQPPP